MIKKNSFIKKMMVLFIASGFALGAAGIAGYAAWAVSGDTDNYLTMAAYQNRIVEEYRVPDHVDPGTEVSKVVNVKNTGRTDTIIRVSIEKAFGTQKKDGTFIKDGSLDPDMIQIAYNTDLWKEGEDGYFYYKDILKAGETTKEPLFTSFTLSPKAGDAYEGKDARIVIRMDSIQAEGDALSLWGMTYKDLGMTAPTAPEEKPTSVTFLGQGKGFDITTKRTDLFAGFKNLLPGCSRTQIISVKNAAPYAVRMYLHAEPVKQEKMDDRRLQMVEQMLHTYASIEIFQDDKLIYSGPVSGNLNQGPPTMGNAILLAVMEPDEELHLKVRLALDPDMDNQFQTLTGKVKWVFSAMDGRTPDLLVKKSTIRMTQKGDIYKYTIDRVENGTFEELAGFTLTDTLPGQVRITELWTGTYNQRLTYDLFYQTNFRDFWTIWRQRLDTRTNYHVLPPGTLKEGEYITKIQFSYGTAPGAFCQDIPPAYMVRVRDDADASEEIMNQVELAAKKGDSLIKAADKTVTVIYENSLSGYDPENKVFVPRYEIVEGQERGMLSRLLNLQWPWMARQNPQTGDSALHLIFAAAFLASCTGLAICLAKKKKKK